jgi:hypothetical protein
LNRDSERIPRGLPRGGVNVGHCYLFVIWVLAIVIFAICLTQEKSPAIDRQGFESAVS